VSTVATILAKIGYRLGGGITISATSDPVQATVIQWLNETALWLPGVCAENSSDLGRTIGTITTVAADITAATKAANCQITAIAHGLCSSGTVEVVIKGVGGMTILNDKEYTFTYVGADTGTLGISSVAYSAYTSGGYVSKRKYSDLAASLYCTAQDGWIVKENSRNPIALTTETHLIDYPPTEATQPMQFYVDGENNVCFPSYPDDVYTVKIPYWKIPTTLTAPVDTIPFL
jgi:hypothetical protein